jgi:hypothetical protein
MNSKGSGRCDVTCEKMPLKAYQSAIRARQPIAGALNLRAQILALLNQSSLRTLASASIDQRDEERGAIANASNDASDDTLP